MSNICGRMTLESWMESSFNEDGSIFRQSCIVCGGVVQGGYQGGSTQERVRKIATVHGFMTTR